jgi:hypothetical protein
LVVSRHQRHTLIIKTFYYGISEQTYFVHVLNYEYEKLLYLKKPKRQHNGGTGIKRIAIITLPLQGTVGEGMPSR